MEAREYLTHNDRSDREHHPRPEEGPPREVDDGVGEDDHVGPRDESDVALDGPAELVVKGACGLDEALHALHALLRGYRKTAIIIKKNFTEYTMYVVI